MKTILVIDDEPAICKMLRKFFEQYNYLVFDAPDGQKGLNLFHQHHPDLIITDLIMPGIEGLETIREIKKDNSQIKIIAISGGGISDPALYLDFAQKFGSQKIFTKPINHDDLLAAVRELIGE